MSTVELTHIGYHPGGTEGALVSEQDLFGGQLWKTGEPILEQWLYLWHS